MPALAPHPTLRLLSLFFPSVTNTSLKTSFAKWMDSKTKSHAHAKEQSTSNSHVPPSQPSEPETTAPITRPVGPSDFLPSNMDELDFISARNAAWAAFQQWQKHQKEVRIAELEKSAQEQTQRAAEASVKWDLAYANADAASKTFNTVNASF